MLVTAYKQFRERKEVDTIYLTKNHPAKRVSRLIVMSQICGVDITFLLFGGWDEIGHGGYLGSLHQISTTCFIFFMITFPAVQCKV